MKIMITGANGFLGRNLADFYELSGNEVNRVGRNDIFIELEATRPKTIIHCASEIYNSDLMYESNVLYTKKILDYCRYHPETKLLILGSSSEYGRKDAPMAEKDFLDPKTMYEATKGMVSLMAQGYANTYDIQITLIRPFTVVGRYEKPHKFFPTLYKSAKNNIILPIVFDAKHDFVFIDDFLTAFNAIFEYREAEPFNIVNIGSGKQTTNDEIRLAFEDVMDYRYLMNPINRMRSFDSKNWVCDTTLLENKYKIKVPNEPLNILDGVVKFVEDCEKDGLYK